MTQAIEEKIRERAYEIWMATGCENGLAELHWLSAEQAVMDEALPPAGKKAPRAKSAKSANSATSTKTGMSALPATVAVRKRAKKETVGRA